MNRQYETVFYLMRALKRTEGKEWDCGTQGIVTQPKKARKKNSH